MFEGHRHAHDPIQEKILEEALEKAERHSRFDRIDMDSFVKQYGSERVQSHKAYVERHEEIFEHDATPETREALRLGTILEEVVVDQIEQNEWAGKGVTTRRASRYDDIKNKVDVILEIEQPDSTAHLTLAIDTTYGQTIERKFEEIRDKIKKGTLATVEYFESSDGVHKGALHKVPQVVLGAEGKTVTELARLWLHGKNKELREHSVQFQFLEQIRVQLEAFRDYAATLQKDDLVKIYERQLRILISIMDGKKEALKKMYASGVDFESDRTHQAILQNAAAFNTHRA